MTRRQHQLRARRAALLALHTRRFGRAATVGAHLLRRLASGREAM
jgi:hypothetical protein